MILIRIFIKWKQRMIYIVDFQIYEIELRTSSNEVIGEKKLELPEAIETRMGILTGRNSLVYSTFYEEANILKILAASSVARSDSSRHGAVYFNSRICLSRISRYCEVINR